MKKSITDLIKRDGLVQAAKAMRKNRKPGIDGETPTQFLRRIEETDLADVIIKQLVTGQYRPKPLVLRLIPKTNGKTREIFIPTVQDGVVQAALVMGLTPLTESRFSERSYGFRPKRNVFGAVTEASRLVQDGYTVCYSVDLETFFPNMDRDLMRKYLRDYNLDDDTRRLINSFITAKVIGQEVRSHQGVPAGLPLAPLLANMYLHALDCELKRSGIPFVRYADDLTLFFRSTEDCLLHQSFWDGYEQRFGIVVNRKKTDMHAEDLRPVLGFHVDQYGGITVTRTVIDKIEKSLIGLLVESQLLLSEKIDRIRQRIAFSLQYYSIAKNFDSFRYELNQLRSRLIAQIVQQFSKIEIVNCLEPPLRRIDEYEFVDETEILLNLMSQSS